MKPLIIGSPEAMSKEPSLDPPDEPRKVRQRRWAHERPNHPDPRWHEPDNEVFPKGIDDSLGG